MKTVTSLCIGLLLTALSLNSAALGQVLFSDDLEHGSGAWTIYPGVPQCTSLQYVSAATDPNANHTPGGSYGLAMSAASDRVFHDVDLSGYDNPGVKLTVWFYDVLEYRVGSCEPFDIRDEGVSQIFGLGAWWDSQYYTYRILTAVGGRIGPNWVPTKTPRTLGWHKFDIVQYRGPSPAVEFFIDDNLVNRSTNILDTTLDRVVLGLGWANNVYQRGYVDDISFAIVPEPGILALGGLGFFTLLVVRRSPNVD